MKSMKLISHLYLDKNGRIGNICDCHLSITIHHFNTFKYSNLQWLKIKGEYLFQYVVDTSLLTIRDLDSISRRGKADQECSDSCIRQYLKRTIKINFKSQTLIDCISLGFKVYHMAERKTYVCGLEWNTQSSI